MQISGGVSSIEKPEFNRLWTTPLICNTDTVLYRLTTTSFPTDHADTLLRVCWNGCAGIVMLD